MMTLKDIAIMFNRAFAHAFSAKKFFCIYVVLFISGLIILFFQGLASYSEMWVKLPLQFIPLFLAIGFIMAGGIFMIRIYDKEREGESAHFSNLAWHSWDLLLKASYLALPLLLLFLIFWVLIGLFMLIKSIPYLGHLLGVILAFAPFLLNLGTLVLFLTALFAFFFAAPPLAKTEHLDHQSLIHRLRANPFLNLLLLGIAYLPVWIVWQFVKNAVVMTFKLYSYGDNQIEMLLQGVFILIPLAAIMTPAVAFFFNFAYESYLQAESDNRF